MSANQGPYSPRCTHRCGCHGIGRCPMTATGEDGLCDACRREAPSHAFRAVAYGVGECAICGLGAWQHPAARGSGHE